MKFSSIQNGSTKFIMIIANEKEKQGKRVIFTKPLGALPPITKMDGGGGGGGGVQLLHKKFYFSSIGAHISVEKL